MAILVAGGAGYIGSVGDCELVARVVSEHEVDACVHLAAFAYVGEPVAIIGSAWEWHTGRPRGYAAV